MEIVTCIHLPWLCLTTRGYVLAQQYHATKQGQARWNCMERFIRNSSLPTTPQRGYLACRISYATLWLADELVKLNATLGSLDKHCTLVVPVPSTLAAVDKLWIYAIGLRNADLLQEWLLESTLRSHPCSSVLMFFADLCNILFPTNVLPSAGTRNLNLCSIWKLGSTLVWWIGFLRGFKCANGTMQNIGRNQKVAQSVSPMGTILIEERQPQTKAMKSGWFQWSATRPSTPHPIWLRVLERAASQMITQITPIRKSHGLKRELLELILSRHEPHRSFIVPRTALGSGWISFFFLRFGRFALGMVLTIA